MQNKSELGDDQWHKQILIYFIDWFKLLIPCWTQSSIVNVCHSLTFKICKISFHGTAIFFLLKLDCTTLPLSSCLFLIIYLYIPHLFLWYKVSNVISVKSHNVNKACVPYIHPHVLVQCLRLFPAQSHSTSCFIDIRLRWLYHVYILHLTCLLCLSFG